MTRSAWVHVKVRPEERAEWKAQAKAVRLTLADLMRRRMGQAEPVGRDPIRRRASRRADPALLTALGRIGTNLNQVAKWANTHKRGADAVQVLAALASIEQMLADFRPRRRTDEEDDDAD